MNIQNPPDVLEIVHTFYPKEKEKAIEEYLNLYLRGIYLSGYLSFNQFLESIKHASRS